MAGPTFRIRSVTWSGSGCMNANTPKRCNLPPSSKTTAEHYALIATASDAIGGPADFPASAARSALQAFPTHLVMLIGALGVALLAESQQSTAPYGVLTTALALGLVPTRKTWVGRRSGKVAILLAIGAILGTLAVGGDLIRILVAASRMAVVIVL